MPTTDTNPTSGARPDAQTVLELLLRIVSDLDDQAAPAAITGLHWRHGHSELTVIIDGASAAAWLAHRLGLAADALARADMPDAPVTGWSGRWEGLDVRVQAAPPPPSRRGLFRRGPSDSPRGVR